MSNGWPGQTAGGFSFGCEDSLRESAVVGNTSRRMSHTVTTIAVAPVAGGILTASVAAIAAATGLAS
jgi:hypothetical protein